MKRMIWTVVFRDDASSPQQELVRYTEEAADRFAGDVLNNGGVAVVIEGDEDIPEHDDITIPQHNKGGLQW